jgi:hypothetical protein
VSPIRDSNQHLELLSELLLQPYRCSEKNVSSGSASFSLAQYANRTLDAVYDLSQMDLQELNTLAASNHVVLRAFEPLRELLAAAGKSEEADCLTELLNEEHARIQHALGFLHAICSALENEGCPVTVIKSLDHWPDLGSDLDLYTGADAHRVVELMSTRFGATLAPRSWGDRLANKWNFIVPGLPELVELHAGRLGQTGEQTDVTVSTASRSRWSELNGLPFRVAAPEDRVVISTLQRMYRHFYIRLCDIVDNAHLLDRQLIDFEYLRDLGRRAGLWEGIATYLVIISQYAEAYRGYAAPMPAFVAESARISAQDIVFRRQFLRVPIIPHSVALYMSELRSLLLKGEVRNTLRLSLMPGLATAAVVEQKLTGSDKGIW